LIPIEDCVTLETEEVMVALVFEVSISTRAAAAAAVALVVDVDEAFVVVRNKDL
jgi:hypothetical protein